MDKIAELIDRLGPIGYQQALDAAKVQAFSNLIGDLESAAIGALFCFVTYRLIWPRFRKANGAGSDDDFLWGMGLFICGALGAATLLIGIFSLADPWLWTAFSHPELWVAKQVLGL